MAKNKNIDAFIETLVDVIMGEHIDQHPALNAVHRISSEFHLLAGLKWDKLIQEYKENSGCKVEGCVTCAFAYRQNMRVLKFIRDIVEPHKTAYIEMINDIVAKNKAFDRLQAETHSQNRPNN